MVEKYEYNNSFNIKNICMIWKKNYLSNIFLYAYKIHNFVNVFQCNKNLAQDTSTLVRDR